ncbi:hypothetical protein B0T16DRAFT_391569 [Cercophora newfieldiana]|uniref:Uncharacterized protein n=1 Tax=Cercophora newfieldiana TaxID=92897 RepID=A0AA39Y1S2_9PEZI|nr:hypothetical protein B0T16DRAFT_391569 [Cercophora newfieldiana]
MTDSASAQTELQSSVTDGPNDPLGKLAKCLSGSTTALRDEPESLAAAESIVVILQQKRARLHLDLHHEFHPDLSNENRIAVACCEVVRLIRENTRRSIDQLIECLQDATVLPRPQSDAGSAHQQHGVDGARSAVTHERLRETVFAMVLGLSRVAVPCGGTTEEGYFQVERQGSKYPPYHTIEMTKARRPIISEMLQDGPCLAAHMHLDMGSEVPALYLFRSPAFCNLQASDRSFLSLFSFVFHSEGSPAERQPFSVKQLLEEVSNSYGLLFRHDGRAARLFRKQERSRAAIKTGDGKLLFDPWLDRLCGYSSGRYFAWFGGWNEPVRDSYSVDQFPLLRQRLERLELFMDGIQPNRIRSIWNDRRDQKLWWTFWTVLIFGCVTIGLAFVSIGVAVWSGVWVSKTAYHGLSEG